MSLNEKIDWASSNQSQKDEREKNVGLFFKLHHLTFHVTQTTYFLPLLERKKNGAI